MNVADIFLVGLVVHRPEHLVLHHFREAEDGVERRAQLVAHRRQEARLGEVGFFGAAARFVRDRLGCPSSAISRSFSRAEGRAPSRRVVAGRATIAEEGQGATRRPTSARRPASGLGDDRRIDGDGHGEGDDQRATQRRADDRGRGDGEQQDDRLEDRKGVGAAFVAAQRGEKAQPMPDTKCPPRKRIRVLVRLIVAGLARSMRWAIRPTPA